MSKKNGQEQESEYVYSSVELGRYYGITVKGMEFYETRGLVHPQRVGQGKVRRFTLEDSYRLYLTRLFKNCGIGIPQTLEMLGAGDMEQLDGKLSAELVRMEEELRLLQMRTAALSQMHALLRIAKGPPFFEVVQCGGFRRLFLRRFAGPHESSNAETLEHRHWNELLPITAASLRFPLEDCTLLPEQVDTRIGLIIGEEEFHILGLGESERTQCIPAGRFLHTLICGDAHQLCSPDWLRPARRYIQENGLRQTGDAFTRFISLTGKNGTVMRTDEAWFPVE